MRFNFQDCWNQSLLLHEQREITSRGYIYASELGNAPINIILAMRGIKPSNLPNDRSLRKFQAGMYFEDLCRIILTRAGVLLTHQERIRHNYEGLLPVSGRIDFVVGGMPDKERAKAELEAMKDSIGHFTYMASLAVIEQLPETEIDKMILEIKSCSSMMYSRYQINGASDQHRMQCFHYMKGLSLPGEVVYVSKDDMLLLECPVAEKTEKIYKDYIQMITDIYNSGELPEKEKEILFDTVTMKFTKNWKIEYSPYLTMVYGFEEPFIYRQKVDKPITSMNRTFKRCVDGSNMTKLNLETIAEAKKSFKNWDDLVSLGEEHADMLVEEEAE